MIPPKSTTFPANATVASAQAPNGLRTGEMEAIRAIIERFPQRELEIRRRCANDAHFRSVCADYEEAATALRHWRGVASEGGLKVEEYANFLGELETEIVAQLDNPSPGARRSQ